MKGLWYTNLMYITATALFIFGMIAGSVYGYFYTETLPGFSLAFATGGFAGSAAGAIAFTLFYFNAQEDEIQDTSQPLKPLPISENRRLTLPGTWEKPFQKPMRDETSKEKIKRLKNELNNLKKQKNNGRQS